MNSQSFIEFIMEVMYRKHYGTKRKMAEVLDIQYRTLQINFANIKNPKRAFLAFQNLILFCEEKGISIDLLYMLYQEDVVPKESALGKLSGTSRLHRRLLFLRAQKEEYIWYTKGCSGGYATMSTRPSWNQNRQTWRLN